MAAGDITYNVLESTDNAPGQWNPTHKHARTATITVTTTPYATGGVSVSESSLKSTLKAAAIVAIIPIYHTGQGNYNVYYDTTNDKLVIYDETGAEEADTSTDIPAVTCLVVYTV